MARFACILLLGAFFASAAFADTVILVGVGEDDPYHAVAERLAADAPGTTVVPFDPEAPEGVLPRLRELEPTHAILVLRPRQIHVNSVRRFLRMAARVDPDPFVDFDYGVVTGATPDAALAFAERIVRARTAARPPAIARAFVSGGAGSSDASESTYELGSLSWPLRLLRFVAPEGGHGRDQPFLDAHLRKLEGCGAILMGGHGMPSEIGSGPQAEDVADLDLFPAVALNYACYTGVTGLWPQRRFDAGNYVFEMHEVEAKRSFALSMIGAGVVGYIAYVNPRPAGPEMTVDFERVLAGETLGAVRRRDQAKVALGYLGYDEPGIVPPDWIAGEVKPRAEVDPVRHMMLDGATGGILYGDPAFAPYPARLDQLPLRTETVREGEELRITLAMSGEKVYLWGADPFRRFDEQAMAMKLYDRVEVPEGMGEIRSVRIAEATWGGKPLATLPPVWAIETDGGRRFLHVKPGFARGGRGEVRIVLVAGPEAEPVDLASRAACLRLATQVGDAVLARRDAWEGGEVYGGRAGAALFLFDLFAVGGDERFREAADALLLAAESEAATEGGDGLYTGRAGVGQVLLEASRATGSAAYRERAAEVASALQAPEGTDVISGAAGMGFFLLNLHAATGEARWLEQARALGDYLLETAVREEGKAHWAVSPELDRVYVGFAHGAAGIGTFLVALSRASGDEGWLDLAREAAAFVIARAHDDGAGGWAWTKRDPPAADAHPVQWCHGSPGIALFFRALADATGDPAHERAFGRAQANLETRGRTARAGGCLCHGVAGNAEILLDLGRRQRDPARIALARTWAADLVDGDEVRGGTGDHAYDASYMTGLAGIGRFLLRLADPAAVPVAFLPPEIGGESDALLDPVREANRATLRPGTASEAAVDRVRALGPPAFRAVCTLIATGEGHWRTHELLRATWYPGGERRLLALADGPALPRFGRWTALKGLGVTDTPEVRAYLLGRLEREDDAGLFMSTAQALALLGEKRAVEGLARGLLAFREGWSGVEPHLVAALAALGEDAASHLTAFATSAHAVHGGPVVSALQGLSSLDPEAAREAARAVLTSERLATFTDLQQARIREIAAAD